MGERGSHHEDGQPVGRDADLGRGEQVCLDGGGTDEQSDGVLAQALVVASADGDESEHGCFAHVRKQGLG